MKDVISKTQNITNYNNNIEKVRKLNKQTLKEIRADLNKFKAQMSNQRFRVPNRYLKIAFVLFLGVGLSRA